MVKTKEELALECANDLTPIKGIQCPRNCKNPGLYLGFIKGYEAALAQQETANEITNEECSCPGWFLERVGCHCKD